ncbi:uncharacterized protein [Triticum aestivum]|uniref:uncharacterized protein isoform X2 n=1 Tax=Triticum aestivum TaxID=4565 RepID=UPI001D01ECF5|nr:uncharacterized protein LOC123156869 isoform X2 [Triticum aestivum]
MGWGDDDGGSGLLSVLADVVAIDTGNELQHIDIKGCGCDGGAPWRACRPWLSMLREHSSIFLGFNGTAGVWRIKALEDSGIWMERTTVEDMDIAVRAHIKGWKFLLWLMTFLVISSPTDKQSKEKRVGSAPNLTPYKRRGGGCEHAISVGSMVLCLGSRDHAMQMGSSSAASPPELQIHDSSIEVSSGKGSHLNISSCDTSTATISNTTMTDGCPPPEEKNYIQRLQNGNGWHG